MRFAYAGGQIIQETNASGAVLRRYVPGPGIDEPIVWYEGAGTGDRRWLHADERGSVIAVSDASGASIATNRYDEYGIPQSGMAGRFGYTGQAWLPELGLSYYKARMYSPTLGRFMQTDPIGYADGMNWYNYVGGDPVNYSDPSGMFDVKCIPKRVTLEDPFGGGGGSDGVECFWVPGQEWLMPVLTLNLGDGGGEGDPGAIVVNGATSRSSFLPPCSKLELLGQKLGAFVSKTGGDSVQYGIIGGFSGLAVMAGSAIAGQPEGVATGALIEKGSARLVTYGSMLSVAGAAISLASGAGKPATVRVTQDVLTYRMPRGVLRNVVRQAIGSAANRIIPDWGGCDPGP